jgi:hypothetical protein
MTSDWAATIFGIYKDCREMPRWDIVYDCHDAEDQVYFLMLDESRNKGDRV